MTLLDILQKPAAPVSINLPALLRDWREDTMNFLRHDAPKIVLVLIASYILTRLLRTIARKSAELHVRRLPPGVSVQQFRTVTSVITSVGVFVIVFIAALEVLSLLGLNLGPMLASAGIAGLAIGFGAQTLVHDFINGFFILLENQFAIGDVVETAGKSGVVERMTMRVVVLRDLDGTMHIIPNGEMKVVSNKTRGWSRAVVDIAVPYTEDVDRALAVVRDEAAQFSTDPRWGLQLDGPVEVLGVESMNDNSVVIRTLLKTQPGSQWNVAREFRRRLINRFSRETIERPFQQRRVHVTVKGGSEGEQMAAAVSAGAAGA